MICGRTPDLLKTQSSLIVLLILYFQGFAIITILQNDLSNGIIGFSESSKSVIVNEDTSPTFSLQLSRINAYFGEVEVQYNNKY